MYAAGGKSRNECDGVKPECRRCTRYGVQCTGYPEKFSFREYKPQGGAATRALPRRSTVTDSSAIRKSPGSSNASPPAFPSQVTLSTLTINGPSRGLSESLDWQSICSFMNQIVLKVHRSPCQGHLAFMPALFQEKSNDPSLRHAILSVSYMALSNRTGDWKLYMKARKNHGLSLEHLSKALGCPDNAVQDEVLAACLLLSMFYNFAGEGSALPDPHMSGICNMLQLRGHQEQTSGYTRCLIGWVIVQIQSQAIGTNKFQYARLPKFIEAVTNPDCVLRAGILNSMISQFCQVMSNLNIPIHPGEVSEIWQQKLLRSLLKRASHLIDQIDTWESSVPPHWKQQYLFENDDSRTVSIDPWTITFLAITYSAQIAFYIRTIACFKAVQRQDSRFTMPGFPSDPISFVDPIECRTTDCLKKICLAVSSTIGFLSASGAFNPRRKTANFSNSNALLWPMWAVATCPLASEDQIALCRRSLEHIGHDLGHKLALSLSKKDIDMASTGNDL